MLGVGGGASCFHLPCEAGERLVPCSLGSSCAAPGWAHSKSNGEARPPLAKRPWRSHGTVCFPSPMWALLLGCVLQHYFEFLKDPSAGGPHCGPCRSTLKWGAGVVLGSWAGLPLRGRRTVNSLSSLFSASQLPIWPTRRRSAGTSQGQEETRSTARHTGTGRRVPWNVSKAFIHSFIHSFILSHSNSQHF